MNDTITPEPEVSGFSEATENDNRDDLVEREAQEAAQEATQEAGQEPVQQAEAPAEAEAAEQEDDAEARAARLARDLREQRRRQRHLEQENASLRGQQPPQSQDEATEREIQSRAVALANQQALDKQCNAIYQEGVKTFGRVEFDESVKTVNETFGRQMMPVLLDTLTDLPNPEKLLQHLADNPDKLDDLANLPPHKLGAALAREATKLSQPKAKPLSKAPNPIKPIATRSASEPELDMEKMSMEQLAAVWDKRDWERRFK